MINTALAIALAVAIAGFCFAFSSGVAEAQGTGPATTGSASVADNVYLWVGIAQGVATIIAIVLGRVFRLAARVHIPPLAATRHHFA